MFFLQSLCLYLYRYIQLKASMKRIFAICYFIILPIYLLGNGVLFSGNSFPIEKRSSYRVFDAVDSPTFTGKITISFELQVHEFNTFGYIFSMQDEKSNNTLNFIFTYKNNSESVFLLNSENKHNHISIDFPNKYLMHRWLPVCLTLDLNSRQMELSVANKKVQIKIKNQFSAHICPNLTFGCHNFIVDLPTFSLRNLRLSDADYSFLFPLNESQGNDVHSKSGKRTGKIDNPTWLINESYYWRKMFDKTVVGGCGVSYDEKHIYIVSGDSLMDYDLLTACSSAHPYANPIPLPMNLGTNFIDVARQQIYVYEINGLPQGATTFARLNLQTRAWEPVSTSSLPVQLHHHNSFFDAVHNRLILFGGFGNQRYNNTFLAYHLDSHVIDTVRLDNNTIDPRFYSGMANCGDSVLYIHGGVGNHYGDQALGKKYYNDLYKVSLKKQTVSKCWEQSVLEPQAVANTMIYSPKEKAIYALKYKEYKRNTLAQLYRLPLDGGEIYPVGEPISFISVSIKTTLSLHLNEQLNELYCIVQEHSDTPVDTVRVSAYELAFPPLSKDVLEAGSAASGHIVMWILLSVVLAVVLAYAARRFLVRKPAVAEEQKNVEKTVENGDGTAGDAQSLPVDRRSNSIYLFGYFTVYDSRGKDITYMFSAKLKYIFLYLICEYKDGILSSSLNNIFWADKDESKIKNLKGVTINHLRKALAEIDGISLVYNKGFFKIEIDENVCYCDYIEAQRGLENKSLQSFLPVVQRGKFLDGINKELFDYHKARTEDAILDYLGIVLLKERDSLSQADIIDICTVVLGIDMVNELAFVALMQAYNNLKMGVKALECYAMFVKEYEKTMGKKYEYALDDVLKKPLEQCL